tara:strand:+ start:166 stop:369 length:204 start_codon:yes stop_codon:yes gene_type:complete
MANKIVKITGMLCRMLKESVANDIGKNIDIKREMMTSPNVIIDTIAGGAMLPNRRRKMNPTRESPHM